MKIQLSTFIASAIQLEAKMDEVLFARGDEYDSEGHLLRNTALVGGAGAVGAGGLAVYGRGLDANSFGLRDTPGMASSKPGFIGTMKAGVKGYGSAASSVASNVRRGNLGIGLATKDAGKLVGSDIAAGAGAGKDAIMAALKNVGKRAGKLFTKSA